MIFKADFANRACCRIHQNDRVSASKPCVFKQLPPRTSIADLRSISGFNFRWILNTTLHRSVQRLAILLYSFKNNLAIRLQAVVSKLESFAV